MKVVVELKRGQMTVKDWLMVDLDLEWVVLLIESEVVGLGHWMVVLGR